MEANRCFGVWGLGFRVHGVLSASGPVAPSIPGLKPMAFDLQIISVKILTPCLIPY